MPRIRFSVSITLMVKTRFKYRVELRLMINDHTKTILISLDVKIRPNNCLRKEVGFFLPRLIAIDFLVRVHLHMANSKTLNLCNIDEKCAKG